MNVDPRWSIRPRHRGRYGVPGLHLPNRPTANEMAFDKLVITIPGRLCSTLVEPPPPAEVLDSYRALLRQRAGTSGGLWSSPGPARTRFNTKLSRQWGTITGTALRATWADDVHELVLTLTVNPTRTLIHALTMVDDDAYAGAGLEALSLERFFARSPVAATARSLDDSDNAFENLDYIISRMGRDHAAAFIGLFERKLKQWALEAVAPHAQDFQGDALGDALFRSNGVHRVSLDWSRLFLRSAEIYCERRHADAVGLMNRLSSAVLAAHAESDWRTYRIDEIGGRAARSTVIGIKPTGRIEQVYYAKARDRVRIETRYHHRVRDNLRGATISPGTPLRGLLLGLREDAASRLQWGNFCAMAEEPPIPMMADFARLAGMIARCATQAKVDPVPVFAELLGSGGLDETPPDGRFPRRLIRRLTEHDLIDRTSLIRRTRPGQPRRHHLTQPYLSVAQMLQRTFGNQAEDATVINQQ